MIDQEVQIRHLSFKLTIITLRR